MEAFVYLSPVLRLRTDSLRDSPIETLLSQGNGKKSSVRQRVNKPAIPFNLPECRRTGEEKRGKISRALQEADSRLRSLLARLGISEKLIATANK